MARTKKTATAQEEIVVEETPSTIVESQECESPINEETAAEETVADETPAEPEEEVVDEEGESEEKKPNNRKFFRFHKDQAKEFMIDNEFASITFYKKFDFSFTAKNAVDLNGEKAKVVKNINRILSMLKVADVIANVHDSELRFEGTNTVLTVFVPYTERTNIVGQNFYRMVTSMNNESINGTTFRVKTRNIAKIHIEKDAKCKGFFKGFVAISHENARKDAEGKIFKAAREYLKTGCFIDVDVGLTGKEIGSFNQFNLCLNKLNLFGEKNKKYENEYDYFLTFNKHLKFVSYDLYYGDDNKLCTRRNVVSMMMKEENVIQTSNQKIVKGLYTIKDETEKEITGLKDVFINEDGTHVLIDRTFVDPNSYEFQTFDSEIEIIQRNIIDSINVASETEEA
jgi:hypothetical protein